MVRLDNAVLVGPEFLQLSLKQLLLLSAAKRLFVQDKDIGYIILMDLERSVSLTS